jgi:hypothetical protein
MSTVVAETPMNEKKNEKLTGSLLSLLYLIK